MHTTSQAPSPATTIAERLSGGEPYIITFGGQATPWRQTLADLVSLDQALADDVVTVDRAVAERLAPVATDLLTVTPRGSRLLNDEAAPVVPQHRTTADSADVSVPGILMAQHAALASLPAAGIDTTAHAPVGAIGHSQGVLGVSLLDAVRAGNGEGVIEGGESGGRGVQNGHARALVGTELDSSCYDEIEQYGSAQSELIVPAPGFGGAGVLGQEQEQFFADQHDLRVEVEARRGPPARGRGAPIREADFSARVRRRRRPTRAGMPDSCRNTSRRNARLGGPAPRIMSAAVACSAERTPRTRGARRDLSW